jgi:hypothetical protein
MKLLAAGAKAQEDKNAIRAIFFFDAKFAAHDPHHVDAVLPVNAIFMVAGVSTDYFPRNRPQQINHEHDLLHGFHHFAVYVADGIAERCVHQVAVQNAQAVRVIFDFVNTPLNL